MSGESKRESTENKRDKPAGEESRETPAQPTRATADEPELFPESESPRYFGTGSYRTGGSTADGNYGIGETNPRGGYGTFTDAGGPGATTLYGEELPTETPPEAEQEERPADEVSPKPAPKKPS